MSQTVKNIVLLAVVPGTQIGDFHSARILSNEFVDDDIEFESFWAASFPMDKYHRKAIHS